MGILIRFYIWCNKENIHIIGTMRAPHHLIGWSLGVISSVQIYYGWEIFEEDYDDDRMWIPWLGFIILLCVYGVLELNHQLGPLLLKHPLLEWR